MSQIIPLHDAFNALSENLRLTLDVFEALYDAPTTTGDQRVSIGVAYDNGELMSQALADYEAVIGLDFVRRRDDDDMKVLLLDLIAHYFALSGYFQALHIKGAPADLMGRGSELVSAIRLVLDDLRVLVPGA